MHVGLWHKAHRVSVVNEVRTQSEEQQLFVSVLKDCSTRRVTHFGSRSGALLSQRSSRDFGCASLTTARVASRCLSMPLAHSLCIAHERSLSSARAARRRVPERICMPRRSPAFFSCSSC